MHSRWREGDKQPTTAWNTVRQHQLQVCARSEKGLWILTTLGRHVNKVGIVAHPVAGKHQLRAARPCDHCCFVQKLDVDHENPTKFVTRCAHISLLLHRVPIEAVGEVGNGQQMSRWGDC